MADERDADGFAEFATSRHRALYRYAYLLAGDRGLAEDLVQEALVKTYVGWRRLRDPGNAEAYGRERRVRSGGLDGVRPGGVVGRRSAYEDTGDDAAHMDGGLSAHWAGHPAHP